MARLISTCLLCAPSGLLAAAAALAQDPFPSESEDLILPPTVQQRPGDAQLERPPPEQEDVLEAVIVRGQSDWRLPELGTRLREDDEEDEPQRIRVDLIPLFDPENRDPTDALFGADSELERKRVGMLKIFEIRFGRR